MRAPWMPGSNVERAAQSFPPRCKALLTLCVRCVAVLGGAGCEAPSALLYTFFYLGHHFDFLSMAAHSPTALAAANSHQSFALELDCFAVWLYTRPFLLVVSAAVATFFFFVHHFSLVPLSFQRAVLLCAARAGGEATHFSQPCS